MEASITCKNARVCGTVLIRAAGLIAICLALSTIAGCQRIEGPTQPSISDDELASRLEEVFNDPNRVPGQDCPPPPDLSGCTRIEITSVPSIWRRAGLFASVLDPNEKEYVESLSTIVVDDPGQIEDLARHLQAGSYGEFRPYHERWADVVCYRGEELVTSFEDYGFAIRTEGVHGYRYSSNPMQLDDFAPRLSPLRLRSRCARNLYRIGVDFASMSEAGQAWPAPEVWTDAICQRRVAHRGLSATDDSRAMAHIAEQFVCPGAGDGKCHYAMNPDCEPNSPPDTVLLFETEAGWNQHGGPELFTFDNHDPRGGCVLLNDGTVRFIRTEKELHALRWK